ncbi:MAG: zinc ribbon domain-containing protein [Anaerolineae bacterium]|nr:zinc ribbon domain-containing protein [Anaerolineae bacterium]
MRSCSACQYENPDDALFCAKCQTALNASPPAPSGGGVHVGGDAGVVRVHDESQTVNNITISIAPQKLADLMRVSGQEAGAADETERLALSGGALAAETRLALSEFEVGADEQEMVLRVFAAPPGLDAARAALSRRLLVLTAAPGSGCYTAALALALQLRDQQARHGPAPRIYALPQRLVVSTRSLLNGEQAANTILVVYDQGEPANAVVRELSEERQQPSVTRIRATLTQVKSTLILVCSQTSPLIANASVRRALQEAGALVEIGMPPPGQVLERHVTWAAGDETWQQLTAGLRERVEWLAQRLRLPRRIAKFAQFYARSLAEQCRPDDVEANWRLAERLAATALDVRAEARSLFKGLTDDRLRWLAVTLCLFHDARLTDFWRLYELLSAHGRALQENRRPLPAAEQPAATAGAAPAPLPSLFADNDADLLLAVHGEVVTVEERLETGVAQVRRVRFEDAELQSAMLGFLQENHHALLLGLAPLLETLVKEGNLEVRIAAARALGAIGTLDFGRLLQPLLERWRDSDAAFVRATVGYTLDAVLAEGGASAEALQLLHTWVETRPAGGDRWKRQWTVAAALKIIGQQRIDLALAEMKRLGLAFHLVNDRQAVGQVLPAFSFTLVVLSLQGHVRPVLRVLTAWMHEPQLPSHTLRLTAALVWAQVMDVYNDLAQAERQRATGGPYHEMVRLALAGEETSLLVDSVTQAFLGWCDIWQQDQRQYRVVLDILQMWAEDAAGSTPARAAVQQLIAQVWRRLAQGSIHDAPRFFEAGLRRWRADRRRHPGAAALAVALLAREVSKD